MVMKIIIPVDLSDLKNAQKAIEYALKIDDAAGLTFLHVMPHFPEYAATQVPPEILKSRPARAKKELQAFAEKNGVSDENQIVLRQGHAGRQILDYAKEAGTDVIVIASHDPGWDDVFLGSVAAFVVRHAHCSVFVIR